jgi:hypothetical protein
MHTEKTITIDGNNYELDRLSQTARDTIASLQFVEEQILQTQNEWAICDTARIAYTFALKRELQK